MTDTALKPIPRKQLPPSKEQVAAAKRRALEKAADRILRRGKDSASSMWREQSKGANK